MDSRSKAQAGLTLMKDAIEEVLRRNPGGVRNRAIEDSLGLRSNIGGKQKGWLTTMVLNKLISENRAETRKLGNARVYFPSEISPNNLRHNRS